MNPDAVPALAEAVEALLTTYYDYGLLNGVVLIAEGDEVVYKRGFGDANMAWRVPNAPDTKFRIGSVTKQFTAALILRLVEEGRIELGAPITSYLPAYPAAKGERVTVHHLLTHTSGIPNYTAWSSRSSRRATLGPGPGTSTRPTWTRASPTRRA